MNYIKDDALEMNLVKSNMCFLSLWDYEFFFQFIKKNNLLFNEINTLCYLTYSYILFLRVLKYIKGSWSNKISLIYFLKELFLLFCLTFRIWFVIVNYRVLSVYIRHFHTCLFYFILFLSILSNICKGTIRLGKSK